MLQKIVLIMRNIIAKELKIKFIETLNQMENFGYEDGNPFLANIGDSKYFVFLKNISSAYFKNSPDVTRVQLPKSEHFSKIFKSKIPFVILGYDIDNDIFVSWNPDKIKDRLNAKSNVSLYSRESLQSKVKSNEFKSGYLSNGEKIILFRRDILHKFFENLPTLFDDTSDQTHENTIIPILKKKNITDKLSKITDKSLILKIEPLLKKNRVLEAVEVCSKHYGGKYKDTLCAT